MSYLITPPHYTELELIIQDGKPVIRRKDDGEICFDYQLWYSDSKGQTRILKISPGKVMPEEQLLTHVYDVAFSIETTHQNPEDTPVSDLVAALRRRANEIERSGDREAFGDCENSYQVDDHDSGE